MNRPFILINAKFPIGQLVITANARAKINPQQVQEALSRHARGDWGDVCRDDARLNNAALREGDRLLSVYGSGDAKFWIITEADRGGLPPAPIFTTHRKK